VAHYFVPPTIGKFGGKPWRGAFFKLGRKLLIYWEALGRNELGLARIEARILKPFLILPRFLILNTPWGHCLTSVRKKGPGRESFLSPKGVSPLGGKSRGNYVVLHTQGVSQRGLLKGDYRDKFLGPLLQFWLDPPSKIKGRPPQIAEKNFGAWAHIEG